MRAIVLIEWLRPTIEHLEYESTSTPRAFGRTRLTWYDVKNREKFQIVAVAVALAAVLLGACGQSELERGEAVFEANCAVCHGENAEGQPDWHIRKPNGTLPAPPLNGDGHTWHHGDGTLYRTVRLGGAIFESPDLPNFKSGMPAFGEKLTPEEIVAVINYVKSLWGDKEARGLVKRESQARVSETDPFPPIEP